MSLKTLNVEKLQEATGNIYESIVILSKRARNLVKTGTSDCLS